MLRKIRDWLLVASLIVGTASPALAEEHGKKGEGKGADAGKGEGHEGAAVDANRHTNHYVQQWVKMPSWQARHVSQDRLVNFVPQAGETSLILFMASWCIPCQDLMPQVKALAERFRGRGARLYYVFAYDTLADAKAFAAHYKIDDDAVLANVGILKDFNQPELPAIFVGDRHGWLIKQVKKPDAQALSSLSRFLDSETAL